MIRNFSVVALAVVIGNGRGFGADEARGFEGRKGQSVGMAMISPAKGGGVSIDLDVHGLPPGEHAIHFHAVPKCEAPFTTAGGHFNP